MKNIQVFDPATCCSIGICGTDLSLSEDAEIIVFERGQHVPFANCGLPYFVGGAQP